MDSGYMWKKQIAAVFFPRRKCPVCGGFSLEGPCGPCGEKLASLRPCPVCATFIADEESEFYRCGGCRDRITYFDQARAAAEYEGTLRDDLLAFKYHGRTGLRRPLAELLLLAWQRYYAHTTVDTVTPVPLHPQRLAQRGYNQSELLSYILSQELSLAHGPELLKRVKSTPPLASSDRRSERFQHMRAAFEAADCQGRRLLLVDDIYTTGATASAAAMALKRKGAAAVYVLTVAAGHDLQSDFSVQQQSPDPGKDSP